MCLILLQVNMESKRVKAEILLNLGISLDSFRFGYSHAVGGTDLLKATKTDGEAYEEIEVASVDSFQGREKASDERVAWVRLWHHLASLPSTKMGVGQSYVHKMGCTGTGNEGRNLRSLVGLVLTQTQMWVKNR